MPGIVEQTESQERVQASLKTAGNQVEMKIVPEEASRSVESSTPSPVPASSSCMASGLSGTSDSETNLNVSSTSEPEVAAKPVGGEGGGVVGTGCVVDAGQGVVDAEGKELADTVVYNIHLSLPGVPVPVDVVLTARDTVHDLLQFALERPECCYRTALSVRYRGKRLDDFFFEIGSIEGLADGHTVELVEESYTQRDVRLHVQRLKDLLSTNLLQQSMLCSDGLTLSFLSTITALDPESPDVMSRGANDSTALELPDYCMPRLASATMCHAPDTPLSVFYPPNLGKHFMFPECLKSLSYSAWNPPPSKRKMKGDLLYLELTTLEGQDYFITATPSGFFLNKSTSQENFDPTPRKAPHFHKHLVGLLSQISPLFKKNFALLQKYGEGLHAFEILPVPYAVTPWLAPKPEHKPTNFRIEDMMSLNALPDELVLGQMRDWNEELQTAKELPVDTPPAKVFRDRALFKIHLDFVQACSRGAQAVVDGYLPSLNPGEERKFRMYLWNNIFFSLAFDGRDHYKVFGGDNAAHAAASADLQGVASFERLELEGLCTLGTTVVDYCGYRVVCQTVIPGLLQREQDSAVVYGSIDSGKNVNSEEKFVKLLRNVADLLHIKEHKVRTEKDEVLRIPSSVEVKGIIGNDRRYYALDLFRIFPPDANFMPSDVAAGEGMFRHKVAILRPEFLDTFLSFKFMLFLRLMKEKAHTLKQSRDDSAHTLKQSQDDSAHTLKQSRDDSAHASKQSQDGPGDSAHASKQSQNGPGDSASNSTKTQSSDETTDIDLSNLGGTAEISSATHVTATTDQVDTANAVDATHITSDQPDAASKVDTSDQPDAASKVDTSDQPDAANTDQPDAADTGDTSDQPDAANTGDTSDHPDAADTGDTSDQPDAADTGDTSDQPDAADTGDTSDQPDAADTGDTSDQPDAADTGDTSDQPDAADTGDSSGNATSDWPDIERVSQASDANVKPDIVETDPDMTATANTAISAACPEGDAVLFILPSVSKPHPFSTEKEGEAMYLLDAQGLMEEKEVGPDIPRGLAEEDLSAMRESVKEKETPLKRNGEAGINTAFKEALMESGSSSLQEFAIEFNVDILSPQVSHADDEQSLELDRKIVRDAGNFLVESVVPQFVHDCIQLVVTPMDGEALSLAMHARGINMRYLGQVTTLAARREDLLHIQRLCLSEMVLRLAKRRLRRLLQETPLEMISEAICHFLNCLLSEAKEETSLANGHVGKKRNKRKNSRGRKVPPHLNLTNEMLWREIVEETGWYYKFDLKFSSLSELCLEAGVRKQALLRDICRKAGLQILLRDYDFSSSPVFTDDDIIAVYPVVKHTNFRPLEPTALYDMALSKFSAGQVHLSHELFASTLQMFIQVYGPMHLDVASCYRHMARVEYMLSDHVSALGNQHKATLILERVLGVDHPETLSAYINLALYHQANNQSNSALRLLYRARYLLLLIYGEEHPEMATCDSNIAIILHATKDYRTSHSFLSNALLIQNKFHGVESLQAALTHHLLARAQSFMGDFRAALQHEKNTFSIYQKKLGAAHDRTKESSECLQELTEKAVTMQKTINEMTGKGSGGKLLAELPGSWGEVVGMVNGIGMDPRQQTKAKPHVTHRKKGKRAKNPTSPGQNLP